jgi:hypothetical protein
MPVKKKPVAKSKKPVVKKSSTPAKSKPVAKKTATKTATTKKTPKAKKAINKTQATKASVTDFLKSVSEQQRKDSLVIIDMMKKRTKSEAVMWGSSIIGFGNVTITSPSGRVVDWLVMGFSPRKTNITLYLGLSLDKYAAELKKLGKHKIGGGCLYINKLEDIDKKVLEGMITKGGFK